MGAQKIAAKEESPLVKVSYAPGDYIFFEGDVENHFYIVESGQVQIFTKDDHGERINLSLINESEAFGELAMLDNSPRSASAQAMGDVSLIKVSEEGYKKLMEDLPVWACSMLLTLTARLKNMNQQTKELQTQITEMKRKTGLPFK